MNDTIRSHYKEVLVGGLWWLLSQSDYTFLEIAFAAFAAGWLTLKLVKWWRVDRADRECRLAYKEWRVMRHTLLMLIVLTFSFSAAAQCVGTNRTGFAELPNEMKVKLWREHLTTQLATRSLTAQQRRLIVKGMDALVPEFYIETAKDDFTSTAFGKKFERFRDEIRLHFSLKDGSEIFEQLPAFVPTGNKMVGDCGCSTTWTFCGLDFECSTAGVCIKIIDCGPFWAFQCNGTCVYKIPISDAAKP